MKVRYVGISFGVDSLTDGKIYECVGIELPFIRIIDDSGEDYLYSASIPSDLTDPDKKGRWEIVEDDENGSLKTAIEGWAVNFQD